MTTFTSILLSGRKMPIRQAYWSDLRPAAEVAAAAFIEDELFGHLLNPHRREYPEDFIRFFEQDFRSKWLQRKYVFLVAVDVEGDGGKVVGLGTWERQGGAGTRKEFGVLDPSLLSQSHVRGPRWD